jgi:hypothetical protein
VDPSVSDRLGGRLQKPEGGRAIAQRSVHDAIESSTALT